MRYLTQILVAGIMVLTSASAQAGHGSQLAKILAHDGAAGDQFGLFVAIDGNIAVVGAYLNDDNGTNSGSAYLFNISDPTNPVQLFKLLPNDGAADDIFGSEVAISGNIAIVGAQQDNDNGTRSGSAYLFDTTTGQQLFKLLPNDGAAFDFFSTSVAISGNIALVGASRDDDNGSGSGAAYLFDTTTGQQIAKFLPDDGAAGGSFGFSAAISGTIAIVGALSDENGTNSGSAYLFDISDPANPVQLFKLLADDGAQGDWFGASVAISGTIAVVGAFEDDNSDIAGSGSAYLFDITTGVQIVKLLPNDIHFAANFGTVAISGSTVLVGAYGQEGHGSAYLFDISDPANPVQIAKLFSNDIAGNDCFGYGVAISGATAIVGAYLNDTNGTDSGSAYLFEAPAPANCPWDLDKSGSVGTSDLLALFAQWGTDGPADFDGSGTVGTSDLLILFANWGPCVEKPDPCGDPNSGSCNSANGTPGCSNSSCCNAVCEVDPLCCEVEWDEACAAAALKLCSGCGNVNAGSCYEVHGTPYCDDTECCELVCDIDPICCETDWDFLCVDLAELFCN